MDHKSYSGVVKKGEGKATVLGFPTVNIPFSDRTISGIFAAKVTVEQAEYEAAVFADERRMLLEAYLINFSGDVYGKSVTMTLHKKIREGMRFTSDAELSGAIAKDVEAVRSYFGTAA